MKAGDRSTASNQEVIESRATRGPVECASSPST